MIVYKIFVLYEVTESLKHIPIRYRRKILNFIETLKQNPFEEGEFVEVDLKGNTYQAKIIGKYALYYFVDGAVKEIKIVDLLDADKA